MRTVLKLAIGIIFIIIMALIFTKTVPVVMGKVFNVIANVVAN